MSPSAHRRPGDAVSGKGGPIGAREAAARRYHAPGAAASATTASFSSPEGAESALPSPPSWHPLPPSFPKRRRVGTTTSASADAASVPASLKRTASRMTWPPERTPRCGLLTSGGGSLFSTTKPRGPTREEEYLGWLGSLRSDSGPQAPRALAARRDAGANANTSAPPSPTASAAARVPPPRRSGGGINASASSITTSSAAPTATPKGRAQASATSPLGSTLPPPLPPALAAASRGDRRHAPPPTTKQPAGTRGGAPPPHQTKPTTGTPGDASLLQTKAVAMCSGAPTIPPLLDAFSQRIIEVLFDLNYGHLGYTGVVLMGVYAGLIELLSGWNAILKVSYVLLLILGAFGLGTGLMAATSVAPTGYTHRVSSVCSRLCTCLATFVFIVALACHMGSHGYIAGIVLGVVAVCYMLSVWIEGDPVACGAYTRIWTSAKDLWVRQWFKWSGQRGPILP